MVEFTLLGLWLDGGKDIVVSIDPKRVVALTDSGGMCRSGYVKGCCIHLDSKGEKNFTVLGTREEVKKKLGIKG